MFLFKENYKTIGKSKRTIITSKIPKNHQHLQFCPTGWTGLCRKSPS